MIYRLLCLFALLVAIAFFLKVPGVSPQVHIVLNGLLHLAQQILRWLDGLVNSR